MAKAKTSKLPIWDQRMLDLMDFCINTKKVGTMGEFCELVEYPSVANLKQIRDGKSSFRLNNYLAAGKRLNVSMDWFMGFTDKMHFDSEKSSAIERLEALVIELKTQLPASKTPKPKAKK